MPSRELQDLVGLTLIENRGHPHTHPWAHESVPRVVLTHVLRTAPRRECASRGGPARNRGTRQAVLRRVGQPGAQCRQSELRGCLDVSIHAKANKIVHIGQIRPDRMRAAISLVTQVLGEAIHSLLPRKRHGIGHADMVATPETNVRQARPWAPSLGA